MDVHIDHDGINTMEIYVFSFKSIHISVMKQNKKKNKIYTIYTTTHYHIQSNHTNAYIVGLHHSC